MGTPLHHAANLKRYKIAALLLEHGADPEILAGDGRTALEIAQESGATGIVKLLQRTS
jgi:ankyrin repeat protein